MTALAPILRDRTVALPLASAVALAALVWVIADPAQGEPAARALLAAGFILWSSDCVRQAHHAVNPADLLRDPHRWTFAALQAATVAAVVLIVVGFTPTGLLGALIGAALTGLMWLAFPGKQPAAAPHWDTSRPITLRPFWRWLYYLLPLLTLAMIAEIAFLRPETVDRPISVMFQAAVFPFIVTLYPSRQRFLASRPDQIRAGGALLLCTGLWLSWS